MAERGYVTVRVPVGGEMPLDDYVDVLNALVSPGAPSSRIHYTSRVGLGRVGFTGIALGLAFGLHFSLFLYAVFLTHSPALVSASAAARRGGAPPRAALTRCRHPAPSGAGAPTSCLCASFMSASFS